LAEYPTPDRERGAAGRSTRHQALQQRPDPGQPCIGIEIDGIDAFSDTPVLDIKP
jgi:hypothetical protein